MDSFRTFLIFTKIEYIVIKNKTINKTIKIPAPVPLPKNKQLLLNYTGIVLNFFSTIYGNLNFSQENQWVSEPQSKKNKPKPKNKFKSTYLFWKSFFKSKKKTQLSKATTKKYFIVLLKKLKTALKQHNFKKKIKVRTRVSGKDKKVKKIILSKLKKNEKKAITDLKRVEPKNSFYFLKFKFNPPQKYLWHEEFAKLRGIKKTQQPKAKKIKEKIAKNAQRTHVALLKIIKKKIKEKTTEPRNSSINGKKRITINKTQPRVNTLPREERMRALVKRLQNERKVSEEWAEASKGMYLINTSRISAKFPKIKKKKLKKNSPKNLKSRWVLKRRTVARQKSQQLGFGKTKFCTKKRPPLYKRKLPRIKTPAALTDASKVEEPSLNYSQISSIEFLKEEAKEAAYTFITRKKIERKKKKKYIFDKKTFESFKNLINASKNVKKFYKNMKNSVFMHVKPRATKSKVFWHFKKKSTARDKVFARRHLYFFKKKKILKELDFIEYNPYYLRPHTLFQTINNKNLKKNISSEKKLKNKKQTYFCRKKVIKTKTLLKQKNKKKLKSNLKITHSTKPLLQTLQSKRPTRRFKSLRLGNLALKALKRKKNSKIKNEVTFTFQYNPIKALISKKQAEFITFYKRNKKKSAVYYRRVLKKVRETRKKITSVRTLNIKKHKKLKANKDTAQANTAHNGGIFLRFYNKTLTNKKNTESLTLRGDLTFWLLNKAVDVHWAGTRVSNKNSKTRNALLVPFFLKKQKEMDSVPGAAAYLKHTVIRRKANDLLKLREVSEPRTCSFNHFATFKYTSRKTLFDRFVRHRFKRRFWPLQKKKNLLWNSKPEDAWAFSEQALGVQDLNFQNEAGIFDFNWKKTQTDKSVFINNSNNDDMDDYFGLTREFESSAFDLSAKFIEVLWETQRYFSGQYLKKSFLNRWRFKSKFWRWHKKFVKKKNFYFFGSDNPPSLNEVFTRFGLITKDKFTKEFILTNVIKKNGKNVKINEFLAIGDIIEMSPTINFYQKALDSYYDYFLWERGEEDKMRNLIIKSQWRQKKKQANSFKHTRQDTLWELIPTWSQFNLFTSSFSIVLRPFTNRGYCKQDSSYFELAKLTPWRLKI